MTMFNEGTDTTTIASLRAELEMARRIITTYEAANSRLVAGATTDAEQLTAMERERDAAHQRVAQPAETAAVRVALDIGGVISKYPEIMRSLVGALLVGGAQIHVITDMRDHAGVLRLLAANGFGCIPAGNVHCADYAAHGEGCKAELLRQLYIDVFLDDFIGYVDVGGCPVRCLVMPDAGRPYYAESWMTTDGEADFGRRTYRKAGA